MMMRLYLVPAIMMASAAAATLHAREFLPGVHCGSDTKVERSIPALREMGARSVRLWADVDWTTFKEHGSFARARRYKEAGFHVTLLIQDKDVPTYEEAKAYFDWAQAQPGMREAVDFWEVINEPNVLVNGPDDPAGGPPTKVGKYWLGTPEEYVDRVLRAAWDSLSPAGETVVGAGTSAYQDNGKLSNSYNQRLKDAGYLNYLHYANAHPYVRTIPELEEHLAGVRAIYGDVPMVATEWNLKPQPSPEAWAAALDLALPMMAAEFDMIGYYRLLPTKREGGWPGLLTHDYEPGGPIYDAYVRFVAEQTASVTTTRQPSEVESN